jgi:hypothetical protein
MNSNVEHSVRFLSVNFVGNIIMYLQDIYRNVSSFGTYVVLADIRMLAFYDDGELIPHT